MTNEERIEKLRKFFNDPDWVLIEEILLEYVEPLKDLTTIDVKQNSDTVKAEVAGRLIAYDSLVKFLSEAGMVRKKLNETPKTFR